MCGQNTLPIKLLRLLLCCGAMALASCSSEDPAQPGCDCPSGCCANGLCLPGNTNDACGLPSTPCKLCTGTQTCQLGTCTGSVTPRPTQCGDCQTGCCKGTVCAPGTDDGACGGGGQSCVDCEMSQLVCDAQERRCTLPATADPCEGCTGCCTNTRCEEGTADTACGKGGARCLDCAALNQICDGANGTCQDCASTCDGCCRDGRCEPGTAVDNCGKGGAACADCKAKSQTCDAQECKDPGTTPTTKRYDVTLVRAHVDSPWYACWEANCDLWVEVTVGTATGKSTTIDDNNDPEWNLYLLTAPEDALLTSFEAKLYDNDYTPTLVSVATCKAALTVGDLDGKEVSVSCDDLVSSGVATVTFTFQLN